MILSPPHFLHGCVLVVPLLPFFFFHLSPPSLPISNPRHTATISRWTHLIRFIAAEDGQTYLGQLASAVASGARGGSTTPVYAVEPKSSKAFVISGDPLGEYTITESQKTVATLLSPVSFEQVPVIKCVGLNYIKHILEGGRVKVVPQWPTLFLKPRHSLADPLEQVSIPKVAQDGTMDYEAELCLVIAKDCKDVPRDGHEWRQYVAGYTVGDDLSWRSAQHKPEISGTQWCMGKGLDSFAPVGPVLVSEQTLDTSDLSITLRLNGQELQSGRTSQMLHDIPSILSHFSQGTTLEKGTLIMTGTPQGVGYARDPPINLKHGDQVEVQIDGIGTLKHGISYA